MKRIVAQLRKPMAESRKIDGATLLHRDFGRPIVVILKERVFSD